MASLGKSYPSSPIPNILFFPISYPIWNSLAHLLVSLLIVRPWLGDLLHKGKLFFVWPALYVASEPRRWSDPSGCSAPTWAHCVSLPSLTYCGSCITTIWDLGLKHMPWMEVHGSLVPLIWSFLSLSAVGRKEQLHCSPFPRERQVSQEQKWPTTNVQVRLC